MSESGLNFEVGEIANRSQREYYMKVTFSYLFIYLFIFGRLDQIWAPNG